MAGDWIKMRCGLTTHPKVVRIMSVLCPQNSGQMSAICPEGVRVLSDKLRVVGGLHAVWSIFDSHSEDGVLRGYTPEIMDSMIGFDGFSNALIAVGWLTYDPSFGLQVPDFQAHNGQSAKRRAEDQKRKKNVRKNSDKSPQSVLNLSASDADEKRTREEKRRYNTPKVPKGTSPDLSGSALALLRARALFRIRPSTPLDSSEERTWKKNKGAVVETPEADWQALEWWFRQPSGTGEIAEFRRTQLSTLLNNWHAEIGKARSAAESEGVEFSAAKKEGAREPEGWRDLLTEADPEINLPPSFGALPESLRKMAWELYQKKKGGGHGE